MLQEKELGGKVERLVKTQERQKKKKIIALNAEL
jgi:hypothetical protein